LDRRQVLLAGVNFLIEDAKLAQNTNAYSGSESGFAVFAG
jgi:hypothetical protein